MTEFEAVSEFKGARPPESVVETAHQVAQTAVRALEGRKTLIISGRLNRLMVCVMKILPRRFSLHFLAQSMKPRVGRAM
jgi:short-subunit dehydrogenase